MKGTAATKEYWPRRVISKYEESDADRLMDFGLLFSVRMRQAGIESKDPDRFLNQAIRLYKRKGFDTKRINMIVERRMERISLGVEVYRSMGMVYKK